MKLREAKIDILYMKITSKLLCKRLPVKRTYKKFNIRDINIFCLT